MRAEMTLLMLGLLPLKLDVQPVEAFREQVPELPELPGT